MRNTKRIFPLFAFYDRTGIEKFLEEQAEKGWLLEKMSAFGWKFRRIEPKKIHFTVTYFPCASAYDPEPSENEMIFREFCQHTGWILAASSAQMQIFRNEAEEPVPIETDALLDVENVHEAVKKSAFPTYLMLLGLGVVQLVMLAARLMDSPLSTLSYNENLYAALCWVFTVILGAGELSMYYGWRRKAKRAAETDGSFVRTPRSSGFQLVILIADLSAIAFMMAGFGGTVMKTAALGTIAGILALTALVMCVTAMMKRLKVSAKINRTVTLTLTVVGALVFTGVLIFGIVEGVMSVSGQDEEHYETYTYKGHSYRIHQDDIPLTIEDLMETDYSEYNYVVFLEEESVLLHWFAAIQEPRMDALEEPELGYSIVDVKAGLVYDLCLNDMLHRYEGNRSEDIYGNVYHDEFVLTDAAPWNAEAVYQLRQGGTNDMSQRYILCYEDRLVEIDFDWEVTSEQMAIVGEILGK